MPAHTHDGIDWVARLTDLRAADAANGPAQRAVATRLIESLPAPQPTVLDVGSGAGGMSAALAQALAEASGGRLVLIDAVPELLESAAAAATAASADRVEISTIRLDLAETAATAAPNPARGRADRRGVVAPGDSDAPDPTSLDATDSIGQDAGSAGEATPAGRVPAGSAGSPAGVSGAVGAGEVVLSGGAGSVGADPGSAGDVGQGGSAGTVGGVAGDGPGWPAGSAGGVPAADLVWASNVTHHLPDQRRGVDALVGWLAPGGCLALAEGGLSMRCLPWDVGVGQPGLQDRLIAAHGTWFRRMRTGMDGVVRLPIGWNRVLADAGLGRVSSFSYLVDVPAPLDDTGRVAVVSWLAWMTRAVGDLLEPADQAALGRLLDPADPAYVGRRDDVFLLKASTVYLGWRT